MGLFESMFDLFYLTVVISLATMLLLKSDKSAKIFGAMAMLLGVGDAFHLIPRVMSHWSINGFETYPSALSWGEAITSVTMTIFYLLYFYYYSRQAKDTSKTKLYVIWALSLARIVLSALPQNGWGVMPGDYTWSLIRNIPFAIMGILLIVWSYQAREKKGLENMALWIFLSFLFYAPVVLWGRFIPILGLLMIPKTVAYVMVVLTGYKTFSSKFSEHSILKYSFVALSMGFIGGVFFREFTKFFNYTGNTFLGKIHVHTIALGFIGMVLVYLLATTLKKYDEKLIDTLKKPVMLWLAGLMITVVFMLMHGIIQVTGGYYGNVPHAAISGLAGIGHILLASGLSWTMGTFLKASKNYLKLNS